MVTYTVCDRCKQERPILSRIKLKGKNFELCGECAESTSNYVKFSFKEKKGLAKLGDMLTQ